MTMFTRLTYRILFLLTALLTCNTTAYSQNKVVLVSQVKGVQLKNTPTSRPARSYEASFVEAAKLEQEGNLSEASNILNQIVTNYSQDYLLHLQLGWLYFQQKEYSEAEQFYNKALNLSDKSPAATRGLAWTLVRQNRCDEAEPLFNGLSDPTLEEQKACLLSQSLLVPSVLSSYYNYGDSSTRYHGFGLSAALAAYFPIGLYLSGLYRYLNLDEISKTDTDSLESSSEHEFFLNAGWATRRWALLAHYGHVSDTSSNDLDANVIGISGRYTNWGSLNIGISGSIYEDINFWRLNGSYTFPIVDWLHFKPEFSVQFADDDQYYLISSTLFLSKSILTVFFGGKYGDDVRPTYLDQQSIYNIQGTINYGGWLGGTVRLGSGFSLSLSYEYFASTADITNESYTSHSWNMGLTWNP